MQQFQERTLAKEDWTHACHLRVAAASYLWLGEAGADFMAAGIQRLNETHGVPLTPTGGYHETLTRLWFALVRQAVAGVEPEHLEAALAPLGDKQLPLQYYSRELLMSWEARTGRVEPDLKSLP